MGEVKTGRHQKRQHSAHRVGISPSEIQRNLVDSAACGELNSVRSGIYAGKTQLRQKQSPERQNAEHEVVEHRSVKPDVSCKEQVEPEHRQFHRQRIQRVGGRVVTAAHSVEHQRPAEQRHAQKNGTAKRDPVRPIPRRKADKSADQRKRQNIGQRNNRMIQIEVAVIRKAHCMNFRNDERG